MHMVGTELHEKILDESLNCTDLKLIAANYKTKEQIQKLGIYFLVNKNKIYEILKNTDSHEKQMLLLKLISKSLSNFKKQFF
ncbi:hypothetical protein EHP00_651 [Ecytonucleospora hepatopenaei]|uniref:Uncharacterized protein n=1 Tax=Ecytonucleospora hepatopenaei TaxID=646526 RepID=A0A1W0E8J3_9MICR|nr:hypothetical protein EHP00_651 [Ecytonucleospora hepatopenaei]